MHTLCLGHLNPHGTLLCAEGGNPLWVLHCVWDRGREPPWVLHCVCDRGRESLWVLYCGREPPWVLSCICEGGNPHGYFGLFGREGTPIVYTRLCLGVKEPTWYSIVFGRGAPLYSLGPYEHLVCRSSSSFGEIYID